jgi:uncharacterized membrane protein YeaQ/YmgE (transglycosylase-associated protein family)
MPRRALDGWGATARFSTPVDGAPLAVLASMAIVLFVLFGLIIGLVARALMPGRQSMGLLMTALLGIAGSFVGGFLVSLITDNRVTDLNTAGVIGSVIGAVLVLLVVGRLGSRRATA